MAVHDDGRILLTPMALIPQRELIVWENEQLAASLARGIADVWQGQVTDLDPADLDIPNDAEAE